MRGPTLSKTRRVCLGAFIACGVEFSLAEAQTSNRMTAMPEGAPPVAHRAETVLPVPKGWPFPDSFSRTSGTGRYVDGSYQWTDFLYDDHGAINIGIEPYRASQQAAGTYTYATYNERGAANNGADIFRVAVGVDENNSYWRVDWNTLINPDLPIALFTLDTDADAGTGIEDWPARANLKSAGIEASLLVSSRGAWLIDSEGTSRRVGELSVDEEARSFVVRIPKSAMPVTGRWIIRVGAGIANAAGDGFEPATSDNGAAEGQTAVYNVSFRSHQQEPQEMNALMDDAQAQALTRGDVAKFSQTIEWGLLSQKLTTEEPKPSGATHRWYVSTIELGQGVVPDSVSTGDYVPNYLGRVQPYVIYVPSGYDGHTPVRLTWIMHSLAYIHTQYVSRSPNLIQLACEQRTSICVTPLGRGPDRFYIDESELDFWEVWRNVADNYLLDHSRTAMTGFSMGGWASYRLPLSRPDVFAVAAPIAGLTACKAYRFAPEDSLASNPEVATLDITERCAKNGDQTILVENAKWVPYFISHGALDELIPVSSAQFQADKFKSLGYRYRFDLFPAEGHSVWVQKDQFDFVLPFLDADPIREKPNHVIYRWYPALEHPEWGLTATGAYWVKDVVARDSTSGVTARIEAVSGAIPEPSVTLVARNYPGNTGLPSPSVVSDQIWVEGEPSDTSPELSLQAENVGFAKVDIVRAGFSPGETVTLSMTSDGPIDLQIQDSLYEFSEGTAERLITVREVIAEPGAPAPSFSAPRRSSGGWQFLDSHYAVARHSRAIARWVETSEKVSRFEKG